MGSVRKRLGVLFFPGPVSSDSSSKSRPDPTFGDYSLTEWSKARLFLNSDQFSISEPAVEHEGIRFFTTHPGAEETGIESKGASNLGKEGYSPLVRGHRKKHQGMTLM